MKLSLKKGQVSKTLLISLIVVVAVLILVWFFWGKQLVGQAIYTGNINTAGFSNVSSYYDTGTPITLTVSANIGENQTSGAAFNLTLPDGLACSKINVTSLMKGLEGGVILNQSNCTNGTISFQFFTLYSNVSGFHSRTFDVAEILIKDGFDYSGDYLFNFTYFEAVDLNTYVNLINSTSPLKLKVFGEDVGVILIEARAKEDGTIAEDEVIRNYEYTLKVNVTPQVNLSEGHLVLVTLNIGGVQKAQFWHALPKLEAKSTEEVSFDYLVPETEEPLSIKVMVWETFPKYNETWKKLIPFAKKEYSIS